MADQHAYSTDDPAIVAVYREAVAERNAFTDRIRSALDALGAGPSVMVTSSHFPGERQRITAIQQRGEHVPEGWRLIRGNLEPRRGKPGNAARQWLADHQPVDVRHVMEGHGLPHASWIPGEHDFRWRLATPELFEHDGTLWACYQGEPGTSDSGFDTKPCTWTPRKLSEFYTAKEAFETARDTTEAVAGQ